MPTKIFQPGHKKVAGRHKGVPNKTTTALKEAILQAAAAVGSNNKGKDGLDGYLQLIAWTERKAFVQLLGRVLPLQITGDARNPIRVIHENMSPQEAAQAYAETIRGTPSNPQSSRPPLRLVSNG